MMYQYILDTLADVDFSYFHNHYFTELRLWERFDSAYIESGCTKGVIIPKEENYVIKIPFNCNEDWERNKHRFKGAETDNGWDYCEAEMFKYQEAVLEGVDVFFLALEKIGEVNGHPIYVQPKAETYWDHYSDDGTDIWESPKTSKARSLCEEINISIAKKLNPMWVTDFIEAYSEESFKDFVIFLNKYQIYDLHGDNLGYTLDGFPIVIDYGEWNH